VVLEITQTVQTSASNGTWYKIHGTEYKHGMFVSWVLSLISHISCQNYFCWIAKFDEDVLKHGRDVCHLFVLVFILFFFCIYRSWWLEIFITSVKKFFSFDHELCFDPDLWKFNGEIWHGRWRTSVPNFYENLTCSFWDITPSEMNERTNEQPCAIILNTS